MTIEFLPTWVESASYAAGDEVIFAGRAWRANRASGPGERPGTSEAWQAVTGRGAGKGRPENPMMAGRR